LEVEEKGNGRSYLQMEEGRWLLSRSGGGAPSVGSISVCGEPTAARGVVEEVTAVVEEAAAVLASPLHLAGEGG
jgi:hypothetical protein